MKNQDLNITARTAQILDSIVFPETLWISDLTSLITPPPHLTNDNHLVSQNIYGFCQYSVPVPARPLIRWHPTRVVFVVALILSSTLLFASRVTTFLGDEI